MMFKLKEGKMKAKINNCIVEFESSNVRNLVKEHFQEDYKNFIACKINGEVKGIYTAVNDGDEIELLTFDDEEARQVFWHTTSHVLAYAVSRLYKNVKFAIGPATSEGFYYDFDGVESFEDLEMIEKEMKKIIKENPRMERFVVSKQEAEKLFENQPYKLEILKEIEGEITCYKLGDFVDLCSGPHLFDLSKIKAVKLKSTCGAYWKGDSKNKMLKRIYGISFTSVDALNEYLQILEDRKRKDHNKLGRDLELFTTVDYIGQGLPILLPKGAKILQILQRFVEDEEEKRGWKLTMTPFMAKSDLYKISGHWDHYKEGMFVLGDEKKDKEVYALRPMTCPFQYQAFLNRPRSYKDLPLRYNETSKLFRNEDSGEMHGLIRVRQFTLSEGHLMCTPEQLEDEFKSCLELAVYMLKTLGLYEDSSYRFSQWDPNNREKYIGSAQQWEEAQGVMEKILKHLDIPYVVGVGEAAFYGPKLDIQIKNVYGKEDTLITIQIDQMLAEKFGMYYIDKDGNKKTPIIIHRSSIGCYERTLAYLIEKTAGAFPMWLAPVQTIVIPVSEKHLDYAKEVFDKLKNFGIRVELDNRNEKLGYKIRSAQLEKVPSMIIVGDEEMANQTISIRDRDTQQTTNMKIDEFISYVKQLVEEKK